MAGDFRPKLLYTGNEISVVEKKEKVTEKFEEFADLIFI